MTNTQRFIEVYRLKVTSRKGDEGITHDVSESTPNHPDVVMALPGVIKDHERTLGRGRLANITYDVSRVLDSQTGKTYFSGSINH